ncbi:MAG: hypothetical protein IT379_40420 [Deltaproteobacteria bacterium]|nr:hypothetical protein [Deltaproteobacteria bacterium]
MTVPNAPAPRVLVPPSWRTAVWAGLLAVAYLWAFAYHAEVNNPNENVRYYMTVAIVEDGTFAIDRVQERWGWVNDKATRDGHVYSVKAPGTSYLGIPAYFVYAKITRALGGEPDRTTGLWILRVTASVLPMLVLALVLHRFVGRRTRSALLADASVLAVALGSNLYGYGMMFVSHATSAAAGFGAFMAARRIEEIVRGGRKPPGWLLLAAGALAASVTALEYPGFVATVPLLLYAVWATRFWKRLRARSLGVGWIALGAAVPTAAVLFFHWRAFGHPLTPGHRLLETEAFRDLATQGFFGSSGMPSGQALGSLVASPECGLVPWTPLVALAPIGFVLLLLRRGWRVAGASLIAVPVLSWVLISTMNNWRGGWTIGPRYLAIAVPFCVFGAAMACAEITRRAKRPAVGWVASTLALGLAFASVIASAVPSAWYAHIPEDFSHPLPQLFAYLWRDGFAPHNAGRAWLGLEGTAGMLPLVVLWGLAALFAASATLFASSGSRTSVGSSAASLGRRAATAVAIAVLAVPVALGAAWPVLRSPDVPDGPLLRWRGEITRMWAPPESDDLSRETERLDHADDARAEEWEALAARWEDLGRYREADHAKRRAARARRLESRPPRGT